jgi:hypothetical protein
MSKEPLTGDFRKYMNKNFLGAWDVPDGKDLVATIDYGTLDEVENARGRETKLTIHFVENLKPMILNSTNSKAISKVCGSTHVEDWSGHQISIYVARVSAFGAQVDALRVRDYAPKAEKLFCADCGQEITGHDKFSARAIAERAMTKYGKYLCYDCATQRTEKEKEAEK